jgi:hypothetical protein
MIWRIRGKQTDPNTLSPCNSFIKQGRKHHKVGTQRHPTYIDGGPWRRLGSMCCDDGGPVERSELGV